jgi:hypothetical protein
LQLEIKKSVCDVANCVPTVFANKETRLRWMGDGLPLLAVSHKIEIVFVRKTYDDLEQRARKRKEDYQANKVTMSALAAHISPLQVSSVSLSSSYHSATGEKCQP